jgi:ABC-type lipoprotein release transport system permease subunit
MYPGKYDNVVLGEGEVLVSQGVSHRYPVGNYYQASTYLLYTVQGIVEDDIPVDIVVDEREYENLLMDTTCRIRKFLVYTDEKESVKAQMQALPSELANNIQVEIWDPYTTAMETYREAAKERVNGRMIVTVTIMMITVVMLFIMQKARMDERKEMLGVYRLLGISKRRVYVTFALETLCQSAVSALPACLAAWGVITALSLMPELSFSMVLPWQAACAAYGLSLMIHLLASLRPAWKFLRIPPAVLAGMYDI